MYEICKQKYTFNDYINDCMDSVSAIYRRNIINEDVFQLTPYETCIKITQVAYTDLNENLYMISETQNTRTIT